MPDARDLLARGQLWLEIRVGIGLHDRPQLVLHAAVQVVLAAPGDHVAGTRAREPAEIVLLSPLRLDVGAFEGEDALVRRGFLEQFDVVYVFHFADDVASAAFHKSLFDQLPSGRKGIVHFPSCIAVASSIDTCCLAIRIAIASIRRRCIVQLRHLAIQQGILDQVCGHSVVGGRSRPQAFDTGVFVRGAEEEVLQTRQVVLIHAVDRRVRSLVLRPPEPGLVPAAQVLARLVLVLGGVPAPVVIPKLGILVVQH